MLDCPADGGLPCKLECWAALPTASCPANLNASGTFGGPMGTNFKVLIVLVLGFEVVVLGFEVLGHLGARVRGFGSVWGWGSRFWD